MKQGMLKVGIFCVLATLMLLLQADLTLAQTTGGDPFAKATSTVETVVEGLRGGVARAILTLAPGGDGHFGFRRAGALGGICLPSGRGNPHRHRWRNCQPNFALKKGVLWGTLSPTPLPKEQVPLETNKRQEKTLARKTNISLSKHPFYGVKGVCSLAGRGAAPHTAFLKRTLF